MFSHYFIVISLNLITVALKLVQNEEMNRLPLALMMTAAVVVFYISIMANRSYYRQDIALTKSDAVKLCVPVICGTAVVLLARNSEYGMLLGLLVTVLGEFVVLLSKQLKNN